MTEERLWEASVWSDGLIINEFDDDDAHVLLRWRNTIKDPAATVILDSRSLKIVVLGSRVGILRKKPLRKRR